MEGAPGRGAAGSAGIQDQIVDGESGVLLDDPLDLAAYGAAVRSLLDDPARAEAIGRAAQERVRDRFLGTRTLVQAIELYERTSAGRRNVDERVGRRRSTQRRAARARIGRVDTKRCATGC